MNLFRNFFKTREAKKSMSNFFNKLETDRMIMIRGGEGDPVEDVEWTPPPPPPPPTTT